MFLALLSYVSWFKGWPRVDPDPTLVWPEPQLTLGSGRGSAFFQKCWTGSGLGRQKLVPNRTDPTFGNIKWHRTKITETRLLTASLTRPSRSHKEKKRKYSTYGFQSWIQLKHQLPGNLYLDYDTDNILCYSEMLYPRWGHPASAKKKT